MVLAKLRAPVDAASIAAFRIVFGTTLFVATLRFMLSGWIARELVRPTHVIHYWGFSWVTRLPGLGMYVVYALMLLATIGIVLGAAYRIATITFAIAFSYAHLCDACNYLNHYYLVSLLAFLMTLLPLDCEWSCSRRASSVRAWVLWLLRFQIAVVYVFGGIGKLNADWLLHGEPLRIWLRADAGLPVLRHFATRPWLALAFSWGGALFDLFIVPLLLWRPTRAPAYALVLVFHLTTAALFNIGMFPWIMIASAPLFFDPSWPRRFIHAKRVDGVAGGEPRTILLAAYAAVQIAMPLRSHLYPGNTLWSEEGFRFAWKVMLIEKSGVLDLTLVDAAGRRSEVPLRDYLTPFQLRMAQTQPDMVLALAHLVAEDAQRRGRGRVRIYADAQVSFNGRSRAPLIDPTVDLASVTDGLAPKRFILPAPTTLPQF